MGSFLILLLDNVNGVGFIFLIFEELEIEIKMVSVVLIRVILSLILNFWVVKYIKVLDSFKEIIFVMLFWNKWNFIVNEWLMML